MPLYEYVCRECETKIELIRSLADRDALAPCPLCGHPEMRREWPRFYAGGSSRTAPGGPTPCEAGGSCAASGFG